MPGRPASPPTARMHACRGGGGGGACPQQATRSTRPALTSRAALTSDQSVSISVQYAQSPGVGCGAACMRMRVQGTAARSARWSAPAACARRQSATSARSQGWPSLRPLFSFSCSLFFFLKRQALSSRLPKVQAGRTAPVPAPLPPPAMPCLLPPRGSPAAPLFFERLPSWVP